MTITAPPDTASQPTEPAAPRFVRADGPDKVTGSGRYTADLTLTGMLAAKFRFAEVAHARIVELDVSEARRIPGVRAILTADDVPDVRFGPFVQDRTLFARDVVRFEGEVVAAVAATTAEIAQRAVDAIVVRYEALPIVGDVEDALADDAPLVHADWQAYGAAGPLVRLRNDASFSSISKGDADAALAAADRVISSRYVADGCHAVPIEPRAIVAQWEGDKVTIWTTTQVPFDARAGVCETLVLPANRVRIIVPHLGGGFGGKCGFHYEAHIAALARAAKRPVRLVFSRREEFIAPDRRREGMVIDVHTGVRNDGTITARKAWIAIDNGAYTADSGFFPQLAAMHVAGPYRIPNVHVEAHLVYTNHQPSGSVRAPTAPQACWAIESHTDEIARELGIDPVDFRRRNAVDTGVEGPSGQTYGEIGVQQCIEAATAAAGYGQPLPDDEAIGVAIGWWPSFSVPSGAYIKIDGDGSGQIITGAQECGTGAVMTLRQLAADELGMRAEDFQLVYQDTSVAPYDMGATGSQTLFNNGRAVVAAAGQVAEQLRKLAADHLEAAEADIVLADGVASVAGTPEASVSIVELAGIASGSELLIGHGSGPPPAAPPLAGSSCVGDVGMAAFVAPQFSCHAVRVRLDRDTGVVRVLHVSTAHDSGTIINELGALGQVEGGVLMGIGQALTEGTRYDDDGRQRNAAMLEYKLQTCADAPTITTHFVQIATPDAGPRGAKGLAEAPNVATAAAISNAIAKLVGQPVRHLPMTAERVWEALQPWNFSTATTLDEALTALALGARPIAGGSDMMVGHRQGKAPLPDAVVAIDRIDQLAHVQQHDDGVSIGALVSHHVIEHHPLLVQQYTALADASALVGSPSTRNVGTLGGNVMNASPAMDTGAPLLVLGAQAELQSTTGSRRIAVVGLWIGPGRTSAADDELCVALHLPAVGDMSGSAYVRLEYRRAMEIAVVGAASSITLHADGSVAALRVALTAVAPVILEVRGLDDLVGRRVDDALLSAIAERASEQARPISDLRATDRYRRHCIGVMAQRSAVAAARRARGEVIAVPVNRALGIGAAS